MSQKTNLAQTVITKLLADGSSLATGESCSGGLLGHYLTNIPGASGCYLGGVIAYNNSVKANLLAVPESLIEEYGAVSEPVAKAMADGVRHRFRADWSVAVTGIAGPDGGTADKPVGLVYISIVGPAGAWLTRNNFAGDRESVKEQTAQTALAHLWEKLQ